MKKCIVTTTINKPTEALLKYVGKKDWAMIIVGDLKTPHEDYKKLEIENSNVSYLSPEEQEKNYPELSKSIGWNCIQRRNIGLVEAYKRGAEIIATVDDDNIPYDNWGENIFVGKEVEVDCYKSECGIFDPLSITRSNNLWHRGFPVQLLKEKNKIKLIGKVKRKVLIQANLWEGDPDIDAIARITLSPEVKFTEISSIFCSINISPFNSQNTFLAREVIPFYAVFPFLGRMDDIWGSYILQKFFPQSVIYGPATVYQARNSQNLVKNLEDELMGYHNTLNLIKDLDNFKEHLTEGALSFWKVYQKQF